MRWQLNLIKKKTKQGAKIDEMSQMRVNQSQ